jgi:hypothetical protein
MHRMNLRDAALASACALFFLVAPPVRAQEEPGVTMSIATAPSEAGAVAVGIEAGLPLVLGFDASYRIAPNWRIGAAVGRLSGMTAIRAEAKRLFGEERARSLVLTLSAGAEQYFLDDDGREATPVGVHAAAGVDYHFDSPLSVGARIGVLKTFGSTDGGGVRVFSVRNDYSTGIVNASLRFHF